MPTAGRRLVADCDAQRASAPRPFVDHRAACHVLLMRGLCRAGAARGRAEDG